MPTVALLPLLVTAGLIVLRLHWSRVRKRSAGMRLTAEVGITTLMLFTLLCGLLVAVQHVARYSCGSPTNAVSVTMLTAFAWLAHRW